MSRLFVSFILVTACASDSATPHSDVGPDDGKELTDAGDEEATTPADSSVGASADAGAMAAGRDGGGRPSDAAVMTDGRASGDGTTYSSFISGHGSALALLWRRRRT